VQGTEYHCNSKWLCGSWSTRSDLRWKLI